MHTIGANPSRQSWTPAGDFDLAVWRFLSDGSLDSAFGGQGWVTHHDAAGGSDDDFGRGLALDHANRQKARLPA